MGSPHFSLDAATPLKYSIKCRDAKGIEARRVQTQIKSNIWIYITGEGCQRDSAVFGSRGRETLKWHDAQIDQDFKPRTPVGDQAVWVGDGQTGYAALIPALMDADEMVDDFVSEYHFAAEDKHGVRFDRAEAETALRAEINIRTYVMTATGWLETTGWTMETIGLTTYQIRRGR